MSLISSPPSLEVCGISAHESVDGIKQSPIEGTSLAYTFNLTRRTPLGRAGFPAEIAKAALWLASSEASRETGH